MLPGLHPSQTNGFAQHRLHSSCSHLYFLCSLAVNLGKATSCHMPLAHCQAWITQKVGSHGPRAKEGAASSSLFTASKIDLWPANKGPLFKPLPPESKASAPSGQAPDKQAFGNCLESHLPACAPTWPSAILPHMPLGRPTPRQGLQSLTEGQGTGRMSAAAQQEPNPNLPHTPLDGKYHLPYLLNYLEGRGGLGRLCMYLLT